METNMRRVEVAPGVVADVPVEVYSRAMSEAELVVSRRAFEAGLRLMLEDLEAVGNPESDARLEDFWETFFGHSYPVDLVRGHSAALVALLVAQKADFDRKEDRMRARLRLPART